MSAPLDAVSAAANATDTAILGYGLLGPALGDPAQAEAARADELAHRDARERLLTLLAALGLSYALADPGAGLPARVADDLSARRLAAQLEDAAAASWRALLAAAMTGELDPGATAGAGALGLDALTGCALRAARWRALDAAPAGSPFPGIAG